MPNPNREKLSILRREKVEHKTGLPRSTIYFLIQRGKFPKPIHLGARAVGWLEYEKDEWIVARVAKRDDE